MPTVRGIKQEAKPAGNWLLDLLHLLPEAAPLGPPSLRGFVKTVSLPLANICFVLYEGRTFSFLNPPPYPQQPTHKLQSPLHTCLTVPLSHFRISFRPPGDWNYALVPTGVVIPCPSCIWCTLGPCWGRAIRVSSMDGCPSKVLFIIAHGRMGSVILVKFFFIFLSLEPCREFLSKCKNKRKC